MPHDSDTWESYIHIRAGGLTHIAFNHVSISAAQQMLRLYADDLRARRQTEAKWPDFPDEGMP